MEPYWISQLGVVPSKLCFNSAWDVTLSKLGLISSWGVISSKLCWIKPFHLFSNGYYCLLSNKQRVKCESYLSLDACQYY